MTSLVPDKERRIKAARYFTNIKTLPRIWGIYMKLVTKYQISAINGC
jgi:hypothetical protein